MQNKLISGFRILLPLCLLGSAGVVHAVPGEGAGEAGGQASSLPAGVAADGSVAVAHAQPDIAGLGQPVSYARLDEVRGGFDFGDGLVASLGIQELAYINGNLVTSTSINIPNIGQITAQQATALASVLSTVNFVQNGPGNPTASSSPIQNAGLATVIQNSLNNQSISTLTTLNISVNTLEVLHELNLQSTLQAAQQLSLSLGH